MILRALTCKNYMSWYWQVIFLNIPGLANCWGAVANSKQNAHEPIFLAGCSWLLALSYSSWNNCRKKFIVAQILCMRSGAQLPELWGMADSVKCPLNVCWANPWQTISQRRKNHGTVRRWVAGGTPCTFRMYSVARILGPSVDFPDRVLKIKQFWTTLIN